MNAEKARLIAMKNSDKLASIQFRSVVERMESAISQAAQNGLFMSKIKLQEGILVWDKHNAKKFIEYFSSKGFTVRQIVFGHTITLSCEWGPSWCRDE